MRTKTVEIYKFNELSETAKEYARESYRNMGITPGWTEETIASLKGLFETSGIKLINYFSSYEDTFISINLGDYENLTGARAMAWLENNLLAGLRIPYTGKERATLRQYGASYYAGKIKPCPFTGYMADDVFLDALIKNVRNGNSLGASYRALASVCTDLIKTEYEYQNSDEYIDDYLTANEWEFESDGTAI